MPAGPRKKRGLFLALEGGEGSGKTTQAFLLHQSLLNMEHNAILVKEPGSTPIGEYLRTYLKSNRPIALTAELLLFEAARAQLVADVIDPSLCAGIHVVTDRYTGSTTAYQGSGRGASIKTVELLNAIATGNLEPDATFLLEVPDETARTRLAPPQAYIFNGDSGRQDPAEERKYENLSKAFHRRVKRSYSQQAQQKAGWHRIAADAPAEGVAQEIQRITAGLLAEWASPAPRSG